MEEETWEEEEHLDEEVLHDVDESDLEIEVIQNVEENRENLVRTTLTTKGGILYGYKGWTYIVKRSLSKSLELIRCQNYSKCKVTMQLASKTDLTVVKPPNQAHSCSAFKKSFEKYAALAQVKERAKNDLVSNPRTIHAAAVMNNGTTVETLGSTNSVRCVIRRARNSIVEENDILPNLQKNLDENPFRDHQNKCRCCFERFDGIKTKIAIMKFEKNIFQKLTEVELKIDSNLAKYLCSTCDKDLQKFYKFREMASTMQKKYYEYLERHPTSNQESSEDDDEVQLLRVDPESQMRNCFKIESSYSLPQFCWDDRMTSTSEGAIIRRYEFINGPQQDKVSIDETKISSQPQVNNEIGSSQLEGNQTTIAGDFVGSEVPILSMKDCFVRLERLPDPYSITLGNIGDHRSAAGNEKQIQQAEINQDISMMAHINTLSSANFQNVLSSSINPNTQKYFCDSCEFRGATIADIISHMRFNHKNKITKKLKMRTVSKSSKSARLSNLNVKIVKMLIIALEGEKLLKKLFMKSLQERVHFLM